MSHTRMPTIARKLLLASVACAAALAFTAPGAHADYAVLRSGLRMHITGYEVDGNKTRLTFQGGMVEIASSDVISFEPEDTFRALPPAPAAAAQEGPYDGLIRAAAEKNGIDQALIHHVIEVESNFNPKAVSRKQARGLMQLLPATAAEYSVKNVFDPAENIGAGTHYLKDLLARYRGNLKLALAAYNAGPEMVDRYRGVPPFAETEAYVRKILTAYGKTVVALQ